MIRELFRRAPNVVPDLGPSPEQRKAALTEHLQSIDGRLAELNEAMRHFRTEHGLVCDRFLRILRCKGSDIGDRERIELQWRTFLRRSDSLFFERNKVLRELAILKEATRERAT